MISKIREFVELWSKQERASTFNDALKMLTEAADKIETLTTERNTATAKYEKTEAVCQEQYETLAHQSWQRNVAREARKKAEDERDTAVAQAKKATEQRDRAKARLQLRDIHDADCASYLVNGDGERLYNCNCGHDAALADEPPADKPPKEGK